MTIKHLRLLGLLTSAAAFAAFGAPSTALAGKSHHVNPYKVEQHVELEGEDGTYDLSCKNQDIAVDGMWRVDNVDQDNDWEDPDSGLAAFWANPAGPNSIGTSPDLVIRKAIRPMEAHALSSDVSTYRFAFTPLAGADVQIKLWVICIPQPLTGFGHSHNWQFSIDSATQHSDAAAPIVAKGTDPSTTTGVAKQCPAKTILIQPGFKLTDTSTHVVTSMPDPLGVGWTNRDWRWRFWNDGVTPAGTATVTWRCLDVKSSTPLPLPSSGHTHKFVFNQKYTTWSGGLNPQVGKQQVSERQQHCGEHYKALLGGWDVSKAWRTQDIVAPMTYPYHMWVYFLGMDPRIKTRAFSFLNLDEIPGTVTTAVVCFKDRTT